MLGKMKGFLVCNMEVRGMDDGGNSMDSGGTGICNMELLILFAKGPKSVLHLFSPLA